MKNNVHNNILCLSQTPPPFHGAALRNLEFINYLNIRKDTNVYHINTSGGNNLEDIGKTNLKKILCGIKIIFAFLRLILTKNIDTLYITPATSGTAILRDAVFCTVSKLLNIKTFCHFRSVGISKNGKIIKRIIKESFKNSKAIIMSNLVKSDIAPYYNDNDILLIQNSISDYPNIINVKPHKKDHYIFLHLSNLSESKGTFDALSAFYIATSNSPNINLEFWIAGPWTNKIEEAKFNKLISSFSIEDKVIQLGKVAGSRKRKIFNKADAFIFPTKYDKECFPGVLLEAMAFGLPCISYNHAAVPDIISHNLTGYCTNKGDIKNFAYYMTRIAADRNLSQSLGNTARHIFLNNFTSDIGHLKLYRSIIK